MRKMRNKENVQRGKQACDAGMNKERKSEKKTIIQKTFEKNDSELNSKKRKKNMIDDRPTGHNRFCTVVCAQKSTRDEERVENREK